jgi:hypothetical protein
MGTQACFSRRTFLHALGAGAVGGALSSTWTHAQVPASARFTRLFPNLPPFAVPSPQLTAALVDVGRRGGIMDANDDLSAGPAALIVDAALNLNNRNATSPEATAGTTFMGQFMDHDMTFDTGSRLNVPTNPHQARNDRTPAFDLDSVYGRGPVADPQLYDAADRAKFRLESCGPFEDLPRSVDNRAVIADPRNDENIIISGLQSAFLLFHNAVVDHLRATPANNDDASALMDRARQLVTWHYHWIILHEILPSYIGEARVAALLSSRKRLLHGHSPAMPVEFQGAAYRFGHSLVRPSYRANLAGDNGAPFFAMIFDPAADGHLDPSDLRGGCRAARRFIGWQTFFDFGDGEVKPRKRIDTRISTPLFNLPLGAIASGMPPTSLAQRNLLRHVTWELPSGQEIAREIGAPALSVGDLDELKGYGLGLETSTPLWYYVLKEADLVENGEILGPVGAAIVGEVIVGILHADRSSFVSADPGWRPMLPAASPGNFRMTDLLSCAGVTPADRGQ